MVPEGLYECKMSFGCLLVRKLVETGLVRSGSMAGDGALPWYIRVLGGI